MPPTHLHTHRHVESMARPDNPKDYLVLFSVYCSVLSLSVEDFYHFLFNFIIESLMCRKGLGVLPKDADR